MKLSHLQAILAPVTMKLVIEFIEVLSQGVMTLWHLQAILVSVT